MQKIAQVISRVKVNSVNLQTEELIADSRSSLTPSQRVDAKLAACSTGYSSRSMRAGLERFVARRPK